MNTYVITVGRCSWYKFLNKLYSARIAERNAMKLSDYIWKYLSRYVRHVFFVPGGGCMHLVDSLGQSDITPVNCMHEQAAGMAAIGYSQFNGLGVCLVTTGPGGTNAVTPCASAWVSSAPVLFISGQVNTDQMKTEGQRFNGMQELDIISIVEPITKVASTFLPAKTYVISSGDENKYFAEKSRMVEWIIDGFIKSAQQPRQGPVWLDIPLDVQAAEL